VPCPARSARSAPSLGEGVALLHLATHADVTDNGLLSSGIVLAASGDRDGWLGVGQIAELPLDGALVVLSGCKTVGGMVLNGEGVQGLTTPFLLAGAQSLVASYWAVLDGATVPLMRDLYDGLVRGKPLSEALRTAQRAAQARGEPPRLWAAFAVVGNGEYRLPAGMQRAVQGRSPSLRGAERR
jgi:CHAT domain-containing protein